MSLIVWTESEILNVDKIDCQHKSIAGILNSMYDNLGKDDKKKEVELSEQLVKEIRIHFDTEEELMKRYSYVNFFSHKLEHDRYYNKVLRFAEGIKSGTESITLDFLQSAKRWLFNHLELNDKKCGKYLASKGVE